MINRVAILVDLWPDSTDFLLCNNRQLLGYAGRDANVVATAALTRLGSRAVYFAVQHNSVFISTSCVIRLAIDEGGPFEAAVRC